MTDEWSEKDYRDAVKTLAESALPTPAAVITTYLQDEDLGDFEDAITQLVDRERERIDQDVDGNRWIIYYAGAARVLLYSDNRDALFDELGADGLEGVNSVGDFNMRAAYYAMRADVMERADELAGELRDDLETLEMMDVDALDEEEQAFLKSFAAWKAPTGMGDLMIFEAVDVGAAAALLIEGSLSRFDLMQAIEIQRSMGSA